MDIPVVNVEGPLIRESAESEWPFSWHIFVHNQDFSLGANLFPEKSDLEVDFCSEKNVAMVYAALVVDKELQPDKVKRQMETSDGKLLVHFEAVEARFLRASFSAFVDVLTLATKVIEQFGPKEEV